MRALSCGPVPLIVHTFPPALFRFVVYNLPVERGGKRGPAWLMMTGNVGNFPRYGIIASSIVRSRRNALKILG